VPAARSIVGALVVIGGIVLFGLGVFQMTIESEEYGRVPFLIIGGIGAATGLALTGAGILMARGGRNVGLLALLAIALVGLSLVALFVSGLLLFALVPVAVALLVVARGQFTSDLGERTS
jgi:peptidoglycan/LPS O-acetylase OafA/YrhL